MITLYLINKVIISLNWFFSNYFHNLYSYLQTLGQNLSALTIPVTLVDILQLCILFLPVGTCGLLLMITIALFVIRFGLSFLYFVAHLAGIR